MHRSSILVFALITATACNRSGQDIKGLDDTAYQGNNIGPDDTGDTSGTGGVDDTADTAGGSSQPRSNGGIRTEDERWSDPQDRATRRQRF